MCWIALTWRLGTPAGRVTNRFYHFLWCLVRIVARSTVTWLTSTDGATGTIAALNSSTTPRKVLVAVAWPYAQGSLHLGHMAGAYLPADIFARYQRSIGNDVLTVRPSRCAPTKKG